MRAKGPAPTPGLPSPAHCDPCCADPHSHHDGWQLLEHPFAVLMIPNGPFLGIFYSQSSSRGTSSRKSPPPPPVGQMPTQAHTASLSFPTAALASWILLPQTGLSHPEQAREAAPPLWRPLLPGTQELMLAADLALHGWGQWSGWDPSGSAPGGSEASPARCVLLGLTPSTCRDGARLGSGARRRGPERAQVSLRMAQLSWDWHLRLPTPSLLLEEAPKAQTRSAQGRRQPSGGWMLPKVTQQGCRVGGGAWLRDGAPPPGPSVRDGWGGWKRPLIARQPEWPAPAAVPMERRAAHKRPEAFLGWRKGLCYLAQEAGVRAAQRWES